MFKVYRFSLKSGPFPQRASNLVDSKTFAEKKECLRGRRYLRPFGRRERCSVYTQHERAELLSEADQVWESISRELIKELGLTSWRKQRRQGQAGRGAQASPAYKDGLCWSCSFGPRLQPSSSFLLKPAGTRG